ncbi:hypothetical protein PICST_33619 [Scheffersomyces stipitis CBS 6054]|uniref:Uncharacterized protein n=1 Tax=Scheffersomyces stipitis (strain ATCC 58785 / CBS 6054 / NBRC 10063 / NRRL Y-11545) TaxID=322104 RepID=A3LZP6_PICST|nr:hypothetical protein PICST_33619 [Scheffersomyces stipitis CBS 6054]ABN68579.2 hypothetical protein PICST_33619 [Scheffersomyces stipitis CBS 6054]KAG2731013.1 hypothetical protein G9P44_006162 [Scheffersomyces stipitis]
MLLFQLIFAATALSSAVNWKRASPFGDFTGSNCNSACVNAGKTLANSCAKELQDTTDYVSYVKCFCNQNSGFWDNVAKCDCADGANSGLTGSELRAQICEDSGIFSALSEFSDLSINFSLTDSLDLTATNENTDATETNETDDSDTDSDTGTGTAEDTDTGTSGSGTAKSSGSGTKDSSGSGTTTSTGTSATSGSTTTTRTTGTSATSESETSATTNGAKGLTCGISLYLLALFIL